VGTYHEPRKSFPLLVGTTIFVSAFLLFAVQPLIAKLILPWFGGSAAVWTTCLLFFQILLLGGYAYAHWVSGRPAKQQAWIHSALLAASVLSLPILPSTHWKPSGSGSPLWGILGLLAVTVGAPYFLLASTGPLVQSWYSRARASALPWRFFAISNAGSMAGLLSYPFLIEPWLPNRLQAWGWSICYLGFAVACASLAFYSRNAVEPAHAVSKAEPLPGWPTRILWAVLASSTSALLLAGTGHITQNIAPIPLLWVLPLSLYLLSFILCFDSNRWYRRRIFAFLAAIALLVLAGAISGQLPIENVRATVVVFSTALFVLFMVCHGELARLRPVPAHLTTYYLMISAGGAAGGALVAVAAPLLFNGLYDFPVVLSFIAMLFVWLIWREPLPAADSAPPHNTSARLLWAITLLLTVVLALWLVMRIGASALFFLIDFLDPKHDLLIVALGILLVLLRLMKKDERSRRVTVTLAALVVSGYAGIFARGAIETGANTRVLARNFYGALSVRDYATSWGMYRNLLHGTILHGEQLLPPLNSGTPTTYYAPKSGVGLAMASLEKRGPIRVGFIGLGAGTLAAYGRPGDYFRFYDINPLVMRIAKSQFTFLSESRARIDIIQGDARLSLEKEPPEAFDLLVVDAFSGDAIPVHLLTREAFALYWRHMKPDGVLAIHTSNSYLLLAPVVLMGAIERLRDARFFVYDGKGGLRAQPSEWVLISSAEGFFNQPELKSAASFIDPVLRLRMWTDDYSDLYHILK
jgi:hypothetical protein